MGRLNIQLQLRKDSDIEEKGEEQKYRKTFKQRHFVFMSAVDSSYLLLPSIL